MSGFRFRTPSGYVYNADSRGVVRSGLHDDMLQRALYRMQFSGAPRVDEPRTRAVLRRDLQRTDVDTGIVGPMHRRARVVDFFTRLLERTPEQSGGVDVWYGVGQPTESR